MLFGAPIARRSRAAAAAARRRCLWVAATSSAAELSAAVEQCAEDIRKAVSGASALEPVSRDACLVFITPTYPASSIDGITSSVSQALRGVSPAVDVIGTVVDRVNGSRSGMSLLFHSSRDTTAGIPAVPFFMGDEHGRQRLRETAVGRWHTRATDRQAALPQSATQATSSVRLPAELAAIRDPSGIRLLLLASDRETRQTSDALAQRFPRASILGMVGAATPFLNARPYTLLAPTTVHGSGCVGLAFSDRPASLSVAHPGMMVATPVLRIARAKGNVVLDVEDAQAAHSLIAAMRSGGSGDHRVYARISRTHEAALTPLLCPGPMSSVFRVTGGDPAKGGVAVDTLSDIPPGCFIQFLVSPAAPSAAQPGLETGSRLNVVFGVSCDSSSDSANSTQAQLSAATEGGFVYSYPGKCAGGTDLFSGSTECDVPNSTATLSL
ncbi:hypothetical protein GGF42_003311 [Coemansia sp. RSA 2424]|nr:hypothetical protein GGF42_003311 [Coemansia sp. RSA 2424]